MIPPDFCNAESPDRVLPLSSYSRRIFRDLMILAARDEEFVLIVLSSEMMQRVETRRATRAQRLLTLRKKLV
ncbi:hypothetical protein HBH64_169580 [Parastagonospora nodorum]|nr:hypothetical protein HBI01_171370 [Parastagonospora nodorum]KAH4296473.1 hypothetical protein HBI02_170200 [Parastagonospora nodorum]KAH4325198.1 hypothetical protein HBI00_161990 [Parastagonospora nodorum]KAH4458580.1 hypothetical protein HBH90_157090 [Parastagonospora nodorum]KAH4481007.1 hypothetical protein HBH88_171560 [Parastagonospora nodorum]